MGWRFDADELLVEALVPEGEGVVVEAEEVQDGGVQIPLVHGVLGDVVAGAPHVDARVPGGMKPLLHIRADSACTFDGNPFWRAVIPVRRWLPRTDPGSSWPNIPRSFGL